MHAGTYFSIIYNQNIVNWSRIRASSASLTYLLVLACLAFVMQSLWHSNNLKAKAFGLIQESSCSIEDAWHL